MAVIKKLMTDLPFSVLLSEGLDSSLVASITACYLAGTKAAKQWGAQLHSFCIGLEGSSDLKAAKEVAEYLGTVHHEFHFTVQDGINAIEDVIYHIETYDLTTIRTSTPMFLMSRKIKSLGVKMVLSGESSDEISGGYLYIHKALNKEEFHHETCQKVTEKMMLNAKHIFPQNTPTTKEAYYYRMTFERFFAQNSALLTVPGGASIACSTATAVVWSKNLDPSGRAAIGVHSSAYDDQNKHLPVVAHGSGNLTYKIVESVPMAVGVSASELTIRD